MGEIICPDTRYKIQNTFCESSDTRYKIRCSHVTQDTRYKYYFVSFILYLVFC